MSEQTEVQATETVATAAEATPAQAPAPDLTVNDLQALRTIIDVASQRGTFKAGELASVGQVYNRLDAFLNHIAPAKTEGAAEAPKQ
jgi:hypothetical protein